MISRFSGFLIALWMLGGGGLAYADEGFRMVVEGSKIIFNGDVEPDNGDDGLAEDYTYLLDLAAAHPEVSTIVLTGNFPRTGFAIDVARGIEGLGLATEIVGECTDGCVYMFVAGHQRVLGRSAKLGLRRMTVKASRLREAFETDQATYGWSDQFGQAAVMYDRGQADMRWALLHLVERGVSLDFALRIFATPREDLWWPDRTTLTVGGVLPAID